MKLNKEFMVNWINENFTLPELIPLDFDEERIYLNSFYDERKRKKLLIDLEKGSWWDFSEQRGGPDFISLIKEFSHIVFGEELNKKELIKKIIREHKESIIKTESKLQEIKNSKFTEVIQLQSFYNNCQDLTEEDYEHFRNRHIKKSIVDLYKIKFSMYDDIPFYVIPCFNTDENTIGNIQLYNFTKNSNYPKYYFLGSQKTLVGINVNYYHNKSKSLCITEGIFDAMMVKGVAKGGGTLTNLQLNQLKRFENFKKIILFQDNDRIGILSLRKDYTKIINQYPDFQNKIYFYNWKDSSYKDLNQEGKVYVNRIEKFNNIKYIRLIKST